MLQDTPIRWSKKTDRIRQAIEHQIRSCPHIKTIRINDADYNLILSEMPESIRNLYVNMLKVQGFTILKVPVLSKQKEKKWQL